jgi:hypothetical protein
MEKVVFGKFRVRKKNFSGFALENKKEKKMNTRNELKKSQDLFEEEEMNAPSNVLDFNATLKELRKNIDPNLVRQREGWRDRNGNVKMVDYVEWHTVADILDETAPNWGHAIKDMAIFGEFMVVTVALTIDGVTREGIGTGAAKSEMGIKKAEHDALKRAAVKFGIARELYKKEFDAIERGEDGHAVVEQEPAKFSGDPVAKSISEMVTTKQLGMIRAVAREAGVDPDEESASLLNCKTNELSRRAASALIDHLRDLQKPQQFPMRRAG